MPLNKEQKDAVRAALETIDGKLGYRGLAPARAERLAKAKEALLVMLLAPAAAGRSIDTPEFVGRVICLIAAKNDVERNNEMEGLVAHIDAWGAAQREAGALVSLQNYDAACNEYRSQITELRERAEKAEAALERVTYERDCLGEAISDALLKAKIWNGEVPLNGPQLLMLLGDLAEQTAPVELPADQHARIREIYLANGFTIKPGHDDLKPYVYAAAQALIDDALAQRAAGAPTAVVYPEDGTVSPFTVINLGRGEVKIGDCIHDERLPALWFGRDGTGMGDEEIMNRAAKEGETLAVVTFSNVEGLDVLAEVVSRIRREKFPAAPAVGDDDLPPLTMAVYGTREMLEQERQRRAQLAARAVGGVDVSGLICYVHDANGDLCQAVEKSGGITDPDNAFVRLSAVRALLAAAPSAHTTEAAPVVSAQAPVVAAPAEPVQCHCATCEPFDPLNARMILCGKCGNKRCPHASDHRNACTGSNEPGQKGSRYADR